MGLSLDDWLHIKNQLGRIEADVHRIAGRDAIEIAFLRRRIRELVAKIAIDQAAKDALQAEIDEAFDKSTKVEDELRAAATPATP